eukprot:TRINITY_DN15691_c0_g1_i1.p1 TRINITY_DN15691_c0_g1~~TRINITY_DN15691_c0_g1_i1.p1  ORF type:complete len:247 (+),score=11.01 TRINITY_DN15691_c0_g1_i1:50-742(+)
MASQKQRDPPLKVRCGSNFLEVIESNNEQKTRHQSLEREQNRGRLLGEPCPEMDAGDITGKDERMYGDSTMKLPCAEDQLDRAKRRETRRRSSRPKKQLNDSDDESHVVVRKRLPRDVEPPRRSRQTLAGGSVSSSHEASFASLCWMSLWSAPRSAVRMPTLPCLRPSVEIPPADDAQDMLGRWCARTPSGQVERMSNISASVRQTRTSLWKKRGHSRVHASFDARMSLA